MSRSFRAGSPLAAAAIPMAVVLVLPAVAAAGEGVQATTTTLLEYHGSNRDSVNTNDEFIDVINKINLSFGGSILTTDLRLDTFSLLPIDPSAYPKQAPPGKKYSDDYRIERLTGVLRPGSGLKLTIGDFYAQFGNGIVLSLRKLDELGLETVLRGLRLDGAWGPIGLTLLGGITNIQNLDPQDLYLAEDPLDRLAGIRLEGKIPGGRLTLAVHGVWESPSHGDARSESTRMTGGTLDAVLVPGKLLLGAEFDWGWFESLYSYPIQHPQRLDRRDHTGYAAYLDLSAKLGPVSILLEGKLYDAFALEGSLRYPADSSPIFYNQPPTAERIDQEIENTHTVIGGRLKVDWRILPSFTAFVSASGGDYVSVHDLIHASKPSMGGNAFHVAWYMHTWGGVDWRWDLMRSNLVITGGWRTEREPEDPDYPGQEWRERKRIVHGELKLNLFLGGPWTLHISLLHEWRMKRELKGFALRQVDYHRGTHIVGVDWAGKLSLGVAVEYDTDSIVAGKDGFESPDAWFVWGQVKWIVRDWLILSVLGGTQRGGLKCVGGVCKNVPSFAGVRTEVVFRY